MPFLSCTFCLLKVEAIAVQICWSAMLLAGTVGKTCGTASFPEASVNLLRMRVVLLSQKMLSNAWVHPTAVENNRHLLQQITEVSD